MTSLRELLADLIYGLACRRCHHRYHGPHARAAHTEWCRR